MIFGKQLMPLVIKMSKRQLNDFEAFRKVLSQSKNIVALTGAGVSAESGIPTFRGEGGLWRKYRSADLATPHAFYTKPHLVWEFYHYRRTIAFNAQPNDAHKALAKYEKLCEEQGHKFNIITQNVDGLHTKAGSRNVIELHGALHKVVCTNVKCGTVAENFDDPICEALRGRGDPMVREDLPMIDKKDLPKCKKCSGLLRPYIVWFGENLDPDILQQARDLVEECDICLVIGTSSVVYPAAMFAPLVAERGKPVAEFNLTEEPASDLFQFHFPGPCGSTLPRALNIQI
ncbi:hypothetical protein NQ315_002669 [Exocentrus adspersus]|uniref:NAD-dependent protein deacylase n=1 Tax=Exocentrus adspersus TaxID=1586481 RepID=A0AAV8VUS4_9CUCU|nr:hypothetical protein NQ315_002669 [Exocentrus adspersus]